MFKVIEVPSELGAGTRGASLGVGAVKVALWNQGSKVLDGVERIQVLAENERIWGHSPYRFSKRIKGILNVTDDLRKKVQSTLNEGYFPLVIGGDHSIGAGSIAGVKAAYPEKRVGVIWIDAHADLHTPFTTPSGNVHGMPLAAAIGLENREAQKNELSADEVELWQQFCHLGGIRNKVDPRDFVFIALRDTEVQEEDLIQKHGMKVIRVDEVNKNGVEAAVESSLRHLSECDIIHLSFDVDSMDTSISIGTGTPVDNGLSLEQATTLVRQLMEHERVACFEIVEVNPTLDTENKMANSALAVLEAAVEGWKKR